MFASIIKDKCISYKNYTYILTEFKAIEFGKPRKTKSYFGEGSRVRGQAGRKAMHRTQMGGTEYTRGTESGSGGDWHEMRR